MPLEQILLKYVPHAKSSTKIIGYNGTKRLLFIFASPSLCTELITKTRDNPFTYQDEAEGDAELRIRADLKPEYRQCKYLLTQAWGKTNVLLGGHAKTKLGTSLRIGGGDLVYYLSQKRAIPILHISVPKNGIFEVQTLPGSAKIPDTTAEQWAKLVSEVASVVLKTFR